MVVVAVILVVIPITVIEVFVVVDRSRERKKSFFDALESSFECLTSRGIACEGRNVVARHCKACIRLYGCDSVSCVGVV